MVGGFTARLPGRIQPGAHPTLRIPEPALGHPRSRRRLPAPGAQAGTAPPPRSLKKRKDLVREMLDSGAELVREGGNHTIFRNGRTGSLIPVPRHAEIGESLARKIARDAKR
jgi:mRNA interferase HicA